MQYILILDQTASFICYYARKKQNKKYQQTEQPNNNNQSVVYLSLILWPSYHLMVFNHRVNFEKFTSINLWRDQLQFSVWSAVSSHHKFIKVNFSKLTDSNQIFRIDFVSIHYHLNKISCQIIECNFFWSIWTLYN